MFVIPFYALALFLRSVFLARLVTGKDVTVCKGAQNHSTSRASFCLQATVAGRSSRRIKLMSSTYPGKGEMEPIASTVQESYGERMPLAMPSSYIIRGQPREAQATPLMAPPGAPTTGMYVEDRYCGLISWIVATVGGFPCACFCPCDRRTVWIAGDVKYNEKGAIVDDHIFLNPFPQGSLCHR